MPGTPHARSIARLRWVLFLTSGFLLVEFVGGILSNSLALLSDAGHMLSDVAALTLALVAMKQMHRPPDANRSYGYRRLEVVSALANGTLLCVVAAIVGVEGYKRMLTPPEIMGGLMLVVASIGLVINLIGITLLHADSASSLGIRGAFLHILGDTLGSVGAIVAAIIIGATGWTKIDALVSMGIALLIVFSGIHLIRESMHILLEGVPRHIQLPDVEDSLRRLGGVEEVHDLHVWRIGSDFDTLTVHLVVPDEQNWGEVRGQVRKMLFERYRIDHCTIEVESRGEHEESGSLGTICERNSR